MVKVIGSDPKRVQLYDLKDVVYYKQVKIYSADDYSRSKDLKAAIRKSRLTVVEQSEDINNSEIKSGNESVAPAKVGESPKIELLLDQIRKLEGKLDAVKSAKQDPVPVNTTVVNSSEKDNKKIDVLMSKIKQLEEKIEQSNKPTANEDLVSAIKNLEEKISTNNSTDALIEKMEDFFKNARTISAAPGRKEEEFTFSPDELYVPKVTVEDANSHIKLKTRTVEKSDAVNDAAAMLKAIKSKSKS